MKLRPRPDFEVGIEMNDRLVDRDLAFAVVDGIRRVGVDELPVCYQVAALFICQRLRGFRWREHERINEEPDRQAEARAEYAANE